MKVEELIEYLSGYNSDMKVYIDFDGLCMKEVKEEQFEVIEIGDKEVLLINA